MELCGAKDTLGKTVISSRKINAGAGMMYYQWIVNNKDTIVAGLIQKRKQT